MDPVIEELCRVREPKDIRPAKLRDWQDYFRHTIQPRLDAYEQMKALESETIGDGRRKRVSA
jgi:hypothetical protein